MAEFKGRRCDRENCNTVVENAPNTPKGWIKIVPVVGGGVQDNNGVMEFCSNLCLATVAVERYEAESGRRLPRKPKGDGDKHIATEAQIEGGRRAAHTRLHTNKNVVKPGCVYCEAVTAKVDA